MAATVEVNVVVNDSALNGLETKINSLDKSTIDLGKSSAFAAKSANSLWTNVGKFAQWYMIGGAVSFVTDAVKDGIKEIRNLDSALVDVNKVMDISDAQLKAYGETAMEVAKKYGTTASDIASSMATWARAGYKDNIDKLAELSTKTSLVGDMSEELATKFLIVADAANKWGGNVSKLSSLVDKANYIDNNYALTLEDIATGYLRYGNVAAMAGMSIDEALAGFSAIQAATQESASKVGTAYRAILLNILKDTTSALDETGAQLTTGQIETFDQILNTYASDAMAAARASGELINPLTAIESIFQAISENRMTDQDLEALEYALGGKLRVNSLDALIKNWGTVQEILDGLGNSAGSADNEVSALMNSWDRKAQQLNSTWVDFLSNFVDTDTVKNFMDAAISGVEMLDSIAGTLDRPLGTAFDLIGDIFSTVDALGSSIGLIADGFSNWDFSGIRDGFGEILSDWQESVLGGGGEQEAIEIPVTVDSSEVDSYEPEEKESEADYSVDSSAVDAWTPPTKYGTVIYTATAAMATGGVAAGGQTLVNEVGAELISDNGRAYIANGGKPAIVNLHKGAYVFTAEETKSLLGSSAFGSKSIPAYALGTGSMAANLTASEKASATAKNSKINSTIANAVSALVNLGNGNVGKAITYAAAAVNSATGGTAKQSSSSSSNSSTSKGTSTPAQYTWSDGRVHSYAEPISGSGSGSGYGGGGYGGGGSSAPAKPSYNYEDLEKTLKDELSDLKELAKWYDNKGEHSTEADTYQQAIDKIAELRDKYLEGGYEETAPEVVKLANQIYDYEEKKEKAEKHAYEDLEDTLDATLDTLDEQIELAENMGDINRAIDLQIQAQEAIAKAIDDAKALGYADDSQEILSLMNKGYDYASDANKSKETLWGNLVDAIQAIKDTVDDANDLAEKQTAVEEARLAYEKAQSQRNVRIFNSATGQWEWIANQGEVSRAQKSYEDAQKSLQDTQVSQALSALKNGGNLSDILISEGLSTLLASGDASQTAAVATALGLLTGGIDKSPNAETSGLFNTDSHDTVTQYAFNGVSISEAVAKSTTLADLAAQLSILNLTTQMPS